MAQRCLVRLRPEHANHVWSCDFGGARAYDGRTVRMLNLIDEHTRKSLLVRPERRWSSAKVSEPRNGETAIERLSALIIDFARMVANQPEGITIHSAATVGGVEPTLRMAPADVHPTVGPKGRTVSALRAVLAGIGAKERMTIKLTVEAIE